MNESRELAARLREELGDLLDAYDRGDLYVTEFLQALAELGREAAEV